MVENDKRDPQFPFPSKFLKRLHQNVLRDNSLEVEIRCIHQDAANPVIKRFYRSISELKADWREISNLNKRKYEILFGVVLRDTKTGRKPVEPTLLPFLWCDIDVGPDKCFKTAEEAIESLDRVNSSPTVIVESGTGIHVYYYLKEPLQVDPVVAKQILRALAEKLGGDLGCAEPARVLRLTGTLNWKNPENPKPCKIREFNPSRVFSLEDLCLKLRFPRNGSKGANTSRDYFDFYNNHVSSLTRRGNEQAMGLCPFRDEKTPSFSVRLTDGVWYCFGCGRKGNVLSFCRSKDVDETRYPWLQGLHQQTAFAVEEGGYVLWKRAKAGWEKRKICDFQIRWDEESRISDGIRYDDRLFTGTIIFSSGSTFPIKVKNNEIVSNASFYGHLVLAAGGRITCSEHDASHIRRASFLFSDAEVFHLSMNFGYQDDATYLAKSVVITAEGIKPLEKGRISLDHVEHARHLDLKNIGDTDLTDLLEHMQDDLLDLLPHYVTYPLVGFLGATPLMHFLEDKSRYALWLVGPSGSGKTFTARLFQSFFGEFAKEGRPVSWSSTPYSTQFMGYHYKDAIFLVDDYKPVMVRNPAPMVQFLQNYADNSARSRLTADIRSRKDYFVRGSMLTTGEDIPAGYASIIARSLIVNVPKADPDTKRGGESLRNSKNYPGVTARYIQYLLNRKNLRRAVNLFVRQEHEIFLEGIEQEENSVRVARNLALNMVGFEFFTHFVARNGYRWPVGNMRTEHRRILLQLRDQTIHLLHQEHPGKVFLDVLREAMSIGAVRIAGRWVSESYPGLPVIGVATKSKGRYVGLYPRQAMAYVREQERRAGRRFDWTPNAVSRDLVAIGAMVKNQNRKDNGTTVKVGNKSNYVWLIKKEWLEHSPAEDVDADE